MGLRSRIAWVLLCAALAAGGPGFAPERAASAEPEAAGLADPDAGAGEEAAPTAESDLEAYWSRRLDHAARRIEVARQRLEEATAEYSRARHDRNPRGAALADIELRRSEAERELADAEAALPRLVEQARRAGVPAGVLRPYWDMEDDEEAP